MNTMKTIILSAALAMATVPGIAAAQSTSATGGGALNASAKLDFQVVVPAFLYFRVGTAGATIDQIGFNVPGANVGDGTAVAGTGGDAGGGAVNVVLRSNAGQVTITPTNNSASGLSDGAGNNISWSDITATSSDSNLPTPTLSNAGGTAVQPTLNGASSVTTRTATWTYSYANNSVVPAGTYTGQVTYTAATP
ncbi:MAG: hypothetical protein P8Y64_04680 [Gammaproteobacteria bacterium]|jgi:hypothetical protein